MDNTETLLDDTMIRDILDSNMSTLTRTIRPHLDKTAKVAGGVLDALLESNISMSDANAQLSSSIVGINTIGSYLSEYNTVMSDVIDYSNDAIDTLHANVSDVIDSVSSMVSDIRAGHNDVTMNDCAGFVPDEDVEDRNTSNMSKIVSTLSSILTLDLEAPDDSKLGMYMSDIKKMTGDMPVGGIFKMLVGFGIASLIGKLLTGDWGFFTELVTPIFKMAIGGVTMVVDQLMPIISDVLNYLMGKFSEAISSAITFIWSEVRRALDGKLAGTLGSIIVSSIADMVSYGQRLTAVDIYAAQPAKEYAKARQKFYTKWLRVAKKHGGVLDESELSDKQKLEYEAEKINVEKLRLPAINAQRLLVQGANDVFEAETYGSRLNLMVGFANSNIDKNIFNMRERDNLGKLVQPKQPSVPPTKPSGTQASAIPAGNYEGSGDSSESPSAPVGNTKVATTTPANSPVATGGGLPTSGNIPRVDNRVASAAAISQHGIAVFTDTYIAERNRLKADKKAPVLDIPIINSDTRGAVYA